MQLVDLIYILINGALSEGLRFSQSHKETIRSLSNTLIGNDKICLMLLYRYAFLCLCTFRAQRGWDGLALYASMSIECMHIYSSEHRHTHDLLLFPAEVSVLKQTLNNVPPEEKQEELFRKYSEMVI